MSHACDQPDGHSRLIRVDFPRMDVECGRNTLRRGLRECAMDNPIRKLTEISPACRRDRDRSKECGRERELLNNPRFPLNWMRHPRCPWIPIAGASNGKHARVVSKPFLEQHIERPLAARHD